MQFLWRYIDDLVGKGLTFGILSELLMYTAATFVPLALPLAILLAALMTFGGLGENYELIALKSAGISLIRIMYPLILLMVLISIGAFFYSNISLPFFNWKMRALLYDIQQQRPELQIKEGIFYNGIENYSIRVGKKNANSNLLHHIRIYDHTSNLGNVSVTLADSGFMKMTADKRTLVITLYNGVSYIDMPDNDRKRYTVRSYPFRRDKFDRQITNIPLSGFDFQRTDEGLFRSNFQMMNLKQLTFATDSLKKDLHHDYLLLKNNIQAVCYYPINLYYNPNKPENEKAKQLRFSLPVFYSFMSDGEKVSSLITALNSARNAKSTLSNEAAVRKSKTKLLKRHEIEWHKKFTLSLACLVFFFIGAPLGAIIRKGGLGLPLVISVVFFVLYYIITLSSEKFVRESYFPTYIGVWFSSFILLPIGVFLTYKATNDSAILNLESYLKIFKKVTNFKIPKISIKKTD